ncbi:zinc-ribbon and DUF3426 domain-containing protein [Roseateles sp.]|uniref:zinc-ribbon and DUF3426 domain-containing protein n=1 Tax=Roseateles sp. TaxID=1971397 RepID=UPI00286CC3A5|nr:zinc-ribbon and DUF3426 domain-containing protein [Roseateles sp.]
MSLATRCSACGTIFRVVEDQLRVSDGWVRCGRCAEVFDARAQLFDIDREAPPPWPAEVAAAPAAASFEAADRPPIEAAPAPAAAWPEDASPNEPRPSQFAQDRSSHALESEFKPEFEPELDPAPPPAREPMANASFDARLEPHWSDEPLPAPTPEPAPALNELPDKLAEPPAMGRPDISERPDVVLAEHFSKLNSQAAAQAEVKDAGAALPEFLRPHAAKTNWQGLKARIALGLLALLLLSAMLLQVGLHFRDTLAALHPGLRPSLQLACAAAGCELKPRQYIEGIGLESSALNQAGSGNHYQLVVGLRNKSGTEVATPWVDVSLTDSAGALVAKRVLGPMDFKTDKLAMPAGSDLSLQTMLSTGGVRISGYSVEVFYP